MAYYAVLDENNVVIEVFAGKDETDNTETDWEAYYARPGFTIKRTSYNTRRGVHYTHRLKGEPHPDFPDGLPADVSLPSEDQSKAFRKNFAGVGMIYDVEHDAFIWPQPFPSWSLDEFTGVWEAPTPKPWGDDHEWSEQQLAWIARPEDGKPYVWNAELEQWEAAL